jgi:hypothetical protein
MSQENTAELAILDEALLQELSPEQTTALKSALLIDRHRELLREILKNASTFKPTDTAHKYTGISTHTHTERDDEDQITYREETVSYVSTWHYRQPGQGYIDQKMATGCATAILGMVTASGWILMKDAGLLIDTTNEWAVLGSIILIVGGGSYFAYHGHSRQMYVHASSREALGAAFSVHAGNFEDGSLKAYRVKKDTLPIKILAPHNQKIVASGKLSDKLENRAKELDKLAEDLASAACVYDTAESHFWAKEVKETSEKIAKLASMEATQKDASHAYSNRLHLLVWTKKLVEMMHQAAETLRTLSAEYNLHMTELAEIKKVEEAMQSLGVKGLALDQDEFNERKQSAAKEAARLNKKAQVTLKALRQLSETSPKGIEAAKNETFKNMNLEEEEEEEEEAKVDTSINPWEPKMIGVKIPSDWDSLIMEMEAQMATETIKA